MLREISCVFVAWFVVYLLLLVHAISAGRDSYARFLDWSANPLVVAVNVVALISFCCTLLPGSIWRRGRSCLTFGDAGFLLARFSQGTTRHGSSYRRSSRGWSCHEHIRAAPKVS